MITILRHTFISWLQLACASQMNQLEKRFYLISPGILGLSMISPESKAMLSPVNMREHILGWVSMSRFYNMYFTTNEIMNLAGPFNRSRVLRETNRICSSEYSLLKLNSHGVVTHEDRILYECFKASWLLTVLHSSGLKMPVDYHNFLTTDRHHYRDIDMYHRKARSRFENRAQNSSWSFLRGNTEKTQHTPSHRFLFTKCYFYGISTISLFIHLLII